MTEFFPPLDLNDTFWAPWATPKDFAWNAQIVGMGIMVSLSCGLIGAFYRCSKTCFNGRCDQPRNSSWACHCLY
jgi:hypothetical protein